MSGTGTSVAWLAQASPRVDVAKVPIRLVKSFEFSMDHFALDVPMSLVLHDNVLQATEELQQQAAAAMGEQPGVCKGVSVNALQAKATARVDVPETPILKDMGWSSKKQKK